MAAKLAGALAGPHSLGVVRKGRPASSFPTQEQQRPWKQSRASYELPVPPLDSVDAGEKASMVFVGNLSYSLNWKELQEHMTQAGNVAFARILTKEGVTWGESLGAGCVRYETVDEAQQALSLNGSMLKNREIQVDVWTGPASAGEKDVDGKFKIEGDPACSVFVGNLGWSTMAWEVREAMEKAGNVEFAFVLTDDNTKWGRSRGCASVRFASPLDADKAIETLNDTLIGIRQVTVDRWADQDESSYPVPNPATDTIQS